MTVFANNQFPSRPSAFCLSVLPLGGWGCPPLQSGAGSAGRARRASSPSAAPPSPPSFPFPRQQGEEAAWSARPPRFLRRWKNKERLAGSQVAPGGPVLPPASPPGSQPSGSLRRLSPPAALLELGCSPQLRPPPRQSCLGVTSILSPRHGASGKVLRGDLLTTDPPQQQRSAVPGSGSLISFILFFCYYCLHLSFIPTPVPSAGSSCPPTPPRQAAGIKHLQALMPFPCVGSAVPAASPARDGSRAWLTGNLTNL